MVVVREEPVTFSGCWRDVFLTNGEMLEITFF